MLSDQFINLMKVVTARKDGGGGNNSPTIEALRTIISDRGSRCFDDMSEIQPHEVGHKFDSNKPVIYSFNSDTFNGIDKVYIVILQITSTSHLYIKLVINNTDNSVTRNRIAYVTYKSNLTVHHDLERMTFNEIKEHLLTQGITV